MALPTTSTPQPVSADAFLVDRQNFWSYFVNATTGTIVAMVVLLLGMAVFLL